MAVHRRWVWSDISPVFTDFSNSGVEYLAYLTKQGEKNGELWSLQTGGKNEFLAK
jgi:hypothetical protein